MSTKVFLQFLAVELLGAVAVVCGVWWLLG